jgi:hypothetical protein
MIEPWITVPSYLIYRYFHYEEYALAVDVPCPFGELGKEAFDGNAAILFKLLEPIPIGQIGGMGHSLPS